MVRLRLLGEPPVAPCPRGRSFSLFELGCTPAFWILLHRDRPSGQSAYYSEPRSHAYLVILFRDLNGTFPQLLGDATEQMSLSLGQTLAGLLNATFGNAVEIIVGIVALLKGEVRIVQTSVCTRFEALLRTYTHSYTWLPFTDAWFYLIKHTFGFGLLLRCRYVEVLNARAHLTRPIAGIFKNESEFSVTAAQTLAFFASAAIFAY